MEQTGGRDFTSSSTTTTSTASLSIFHHSPIWIKTGGFVINKMVTENNHFWQQIKPNQKLGIQMKIFSEANDSNYRQISCKNRDFPENYTATQGVNTLTYTKILCNWLNITISAQITQTYRALETPHTCSLGCFHDDVIKWKHFPRYWPFVRGIHRSLVNSPYKDQLWCFLWSASE